MNGITTETKGVIESGSVSAGEALVDLLADYGVELVFGIPGTHSIELYRGLGKGHIRHISPRHEQGGGFMADGYARISGKPGVCFVITGPGVTNISTPMGEAYMDSVPMLVISPVNDPDPDEVNRGRLHEITSQTKVTKPLTASSITISNAKEIPGAVADAFRIFDSERPRPVHINIPLSIIPQSVDGEWRAKVPPAMARATDSELDAALDRLGNANNPVMLVGGGASAAAESVRELAETVACPVITTVAGRGILSGDHPLSVGAQLRAPHAQRVLESADLGLFLGTELAQTDHWNDDLKLPENQVWVNICPEVLDLRPDALTIRADCGDFCQRLAKRLPKTSPERTENIQKFCAGVRSGHSETMTDKERLHWGVLEEIMAGTPDSATIVSDMTQIAYTAVDYLPMSRPRQWLHPVGYGTLGYALPAAIGAVLADPANPALVLVGDAGLQYTMQEMTLASELSLNIVVLLWNNDALQQICDDMDNAGIARTGIFQQNPDFIALTRACGWNARQLSRLEELEDALEAAFNEPGPVLLKLDEKSLNPD